MAAPTPQHPIAGNQTFERFLEVLTSADLTKKRYDSLKAQAALLTTRIEETVKVKELEGAHGRALKMEKEAKVTLHNAQIVANRTMDEGKEYVRGLRDTLEADQDSLAKAQEEFRSEHAVSMDAVETVAAAATAKLEKAKVQVLKAEKLHAAAVLIKTEYEAKAAALKALGI